MYKATIKKSSLNNLYDDPVASPGKKRTISVTTASLDKTDPEEKIYQSWKQKPTSLLEYFGGRGRSIERSQMLKRFQERLKKEKSGLNALYSN